MGNNQISTLLLLLVLGFLIYYLTKPSNINESFTNPSQNIPIISVNEPNLNTSLLTSAMPKQMATSMLQSNNLTSNISHDVIKEIISETEAPVTTNNSNNIYNFEPNNNTTDMGAELNSAFDKTDVPMLTPDIVNVNKNNVSHYDAKDFLPKEINDKWFDTDFSQAKFNINDDKLINTERYIIGINTVGQSLKNASYDIRGTVPNPKYSVSPWNNSTIEADYNIKSLC